MKELIEYLKRNDATAAIRMLDSEAGSFGFFRQVC